jgi:hypothetical protein
VASLTLISDNRRKPLRFILDPAQGSLQWAQINGERPQCLFADRSRLIEIGEGRTTFRKNFRPQLDRVGAQMGSEVWLSGSLAGLIVNPVFFEDQSDLLNTA